MAKQRVPAGLRGTTRLGSNGQTSKPLCGATPSWIKGQGTPAPRLLCCLRDGHSAKRHKDGRGHEWDVVGAGRPPRVAHR
jgi:hypothetical protein